MRKSLAAALLLPCVFLVLATMVQAEYEFDAAFATRMLRFSAVTYCPKADVRAFNCSICARDISGFQMIDTFYDSHTTTFGYCGVDYATNHILVAYEGTNPLDLENWITDLSTESVSGSSFLNYPNLRVHEGFFNAYRTVQQRTQECVLRLRDEHPDMGIAVTGHSLGAALGTLAALDIYAMTGVSPRVYNFGCPRIGNSVFAGVLESAIPDYFRVVHNRDIVPHVPLKIMGFSHARNEVWYTEDFGSYKLCRSGESSSCSDSLWFPDSVPDHLKYMNIPVGSFCYV